MKRPLFIFAVLLTVLPLAGCGSSSSVSLESSMSSSSEVSSSLFDYNIHDVSNAGSSAYYEIFVGSFRDSDGDGMGDLNGVTSKLDYLENLGVGGIWFMPIMPSPTYHKYDITDYYDIDSAYGTMDDFDNYIEAANAHHIDTIIDLVVNHTSSAHPWFIQAYNDYVNGNCSTDADKCNWYNFSSTPKTGYNQMGTTGVYYESRFWSGMPDLNLDNDYVRDEITNICHFWIDKGVKGFRLDAVTSYYTGSISKNIDFLTWLNTMVKEYKSDAYIVGEGPWDNVPANIQTYYNSGVDSFFNFTVAQATGHMVGAVNNQTGRAFADFISTYNADLRAINPLAIDAPFLSNHDLGRSAGYFAGLDADYKRKLAASAYLLMPGKPFIYYGEEISLRGSGNDQSKRLPMIWSSTDTTGACNPPVGYDYNLANQVTQGVDDLLLIPDSMTNHYRKVISLRNYYNDYIASGAVASITLNDALFALQFTREDNSQILVVTNFSSEPVTADLPSQMAILDQIKTLGIAGSVTNSGGIYSLTVAGYSTLILQ